MYLWLGAGVNFWPTERGSQQLWVTKEVPNYPVLNKGDLDTQQTLLYFQLLVQQLSFKLRNIYAIILSTARVVNCFASYAYYTVGRSSFYLIYCLSTQILPIKLIYTGKYVFGLNVLLLHFKISKLLLQIRQFFNQGQSNTLLPNKCINDQVVHNNRQLSEYQEQ